MSMLSRTISTAGSTTISNGVATNTLIPTAGSPVDIATFSAAAALVNLSVSGSGTVTVTPTGGGGAINSGLYQLIGSTYNLVATPAAGYYFTGWTGYYATDVASASSASTTLTINGPENLVAGFATIPGYVVNTAADSNDGVGGCDSMPEGQMLAARCSGGLRRGRYRQHHLLVRGLQCAHHHHAGLKFEPPDTD